MPIMKLLSEKINKNYFQKNVLVWWNKCYTLKKKRDPALCKFLIANGFRILVENINLTYQ